MKLRAAVTPRMVNKPVGAGQVELVCLEIEPTEHGYHLFRCDADGGVLGDTWHLTIDDAKDQAVYEFEVVADDAWVEVK